MNKSCDNCIRPRICYLMNKDAGWCENCNQCLEKDCQSKITHRVHWNNMIRDTCSQHAKPLYCCYPKDKPYTTSPFIYKI